MSLFSGKGGKKRHFFIFSVIFLVGMIVLFFFIIPPVHDRTIPETVNLHTDDRSVSRSAAQIISPSMLKSSMSLERIRRNVCVGDTVHSILSSIGLDNNLIIRVVQALKLRYDPRQIVPGQALMVLFRSDGRKDSKRIFHGISLKTSYDKELLVTSTQTGAFDICERECPLTMRIVRTEGVVKETLYEAARSAGLSENILMQLIEPFSFDVDFQRDLKGGESFNVVYEEYFDQDGVLVREGPVLYAHLLVRGESLKVYRFTAADGVPDYYNERGQSVRKTLLRTPINGARLSSRYGLRHHPIKGFSIMHQGVDFAAPLGTPVMASGSGTVTFGGWKGNYGKYVSIRHNHEYSTAYAHLSRIAPKVRSGGRISQGDVLGYVGDTGMATGPHLHYEVHKYGRQVNPARVKFPPGRILQGNELHRFFAVTESIEGIYIGAGAIASKNPA